MVTHSSTLAWKIPWTEEPGRLQSIGSLSRTRLSDFTFTFHFHALEKEMATPSSFLAWRIPGMGEPDGLLSIGLNRVGHDWSDLAAAASKIGFIAVFFGFVNCLLLSLAHFSIKLFVFFFLSCRSSLYDSGIWTVFLTSCIMKMKMKVTQSCPILCDPMDCSPPGPLSRQEYWSELPFPSPEDLPDPGIESGSPALQADSLPTELLVKPFIMTQLHLLNMG